MTTPAAIDAATTTAPNTDVTPAVPPAVADVTDRADTADDIADADTVGAEFDESGTPLNLAAARKLRRENQGLRERLRATTAAAEQAQTVADGARRAEVSRIAAAALHDARDLLDRADVATLLAADGTVDHAAVAAAIAALTADRPHLAKPSNFPPPSDRLVESLHPGASGAPVPVPQPSWAAAFGNGG